MAKESHFLTIGTAHKPEQTNTTSFAGRILDLRTKVMMCGYNFITKLILWKKEPLPSLFSPMFSPDLYLIHLFVFLKSSPSTVLNSSSSSQGNHKPIRRRLPSKSALTLIALWSFVFPTVSAKQLYPTILPALQTCHCPKRKSCGINTYKWLLHKTDMGLRPGSNQVGDLGDAERYKGNTNWEACCSVLG